MKTPPMAPKSTALATGTAKATQPTKPAKVTKAAKAAEAPKAKKSVAKVAARAPAAPLSSPPVSAKASKASPPMPTMPNDSPASMAAASLMVATPGRGKDKLVRDSFTMPRADYALIAQVKERALALRRPTKKSELLRAGLQVLAALGDEALLLGLAYQLERAASWSQRIPAVASSIHRPSDQ